MGISGTWKARQYAPYAGAQKQGTGWNPVHAIADTGYGRNVAPDAITEPVPAEFLTDDDYGYQSEDSTSALWGYGTETGTANRPPLGTSDNRGTVDGYPPYGPRRAGVPGGGVIRSVDNGAQAGFTAKTTQPDAQQGFIDKIVGGVEDSQISDPAQYEMQTSMTQRDKVRAGSQRGSGSASEYDAPIGSDRPTRGQRQYIPSTGTRLGEMFPAQQELLIRPWYYRTAGTPDPALMDPNEMYSSVPLQRTPNSDPYQGISVPTDTIAGFIDEGWTQ